MFCDKAIKSFKVNKKNIEAALNKNPILVTALNPLIGYAKAAEIAKKAYKENLQIIEVALTETNLTRAQLNKYLDPKKLTKEVLNGSENLLESSCEACREDAPRVTQEEINELKPQIPAGKFKQLTASID